MTLTDTADRPLATLGDGTEVTILAWLPGSADTRYRVRVTDSGLEGWLPVGDLRGKATITSPPAEPRPPVPRPALRAAASGSSRRRFGQRL